MIIFSCLLSTKLCLRFLLNCFVRDIKDFYQSSLGNEVVFRDIANVSPNILAKNQNFKKLRHSFADERGLITTTLISCCHWKTLVPFCLRKIKPETHFNTNSELLYSHKKQILMTMIIAKSYKKTNYANENNNKLPI